MTDHAIVVLEKVQASDVDSYNRVGVSSVDFDNGWVARLLTQSATAGESEVWTATIPASGAGLLNLWMAYSPEVVSVVSGSNRFKGIDVDPQHFYTVAGDMIDFFRPLVGDIITLTAEAITGTKAANTYIVATNNDYKLNWNATAVSGLSLKLLETSYVSKPTGAIGETQRVTAYKFEVAAVA